MRNISTRLAVLAVLVFAANYNHDKKNNAQALAYSSKAIEVLQTKPKPEEISEADWEKKKQTMLGIAYWTQGVSYNDQKQYAQAVEIFKLNVESYPQSANVYDSLGEAYMMNGERDLAIKNYEKSLVLNPANQGAITALKKLRGN